MSKQIIILDTETTGFQRYDKIIALAALRTRSTGSDAEFLYRCFDPRKDSHPGALRVHGWDDWTTRFQDLFADHATELHSWLSEADLLVMHNAEFDLHFVNREFRKCGLPPLSAPAYCTLQQARVRWPGGAGLDACAKRLGLERIAAKHHPLEDAFLTWNLYRYFHGAPLIALRENWPEPENLRPAPPRPTGELPRRSAKRPGTAGLRWTPPQRKSVEDFARPVAILLVFLALSDNHFAVQEKAVIWELVRRSADRLGLTPSELDTEVVGAQLLELEPTGNLITRAMKAVLRDDFWREHLPKLMTSMVMADGVFVRDERAALSIIKDTLLKQQPLAVDDALPMSTSAYTTPT